MPYTETVSEFFDRLKIPTNTANTGSVQFEIEDESTYHLNLKTGDVSTKANAEKPAVIVRARALDFMALIEGRMSIEDGLLTERLHVAGDMLKITNILTTLRNTPQN
ncbi:MAG: SCP2 sterol-binding domain-containing protein [Myxococcota bacterium]|nr:SCP2 sterol-binding domain-containing protein [Myxococcota bacterium]